MPFEQSFYYLYNNPTIDNTDYEDSRWQQVTLPSPEPTYSKIYDGEWLDDTLPYHVIHRIASNPEAHGIFSTIMDFCFSHDSNIRIDTHKDNRIMQHNIEKHGFTYCGIIYLVNGDERLAYQKLT